MARPSSARPEPLPRGSQAPDFNLHVTPDQSVSLTDCAGTPTVLVFYPADFSPVCSDELGIFNELLPEFQRMGAQVLGISVDNVWSHLAFARERHIHFPLLSDFHPKGEMASRYHAYREDTGVCERALFVVDGAGKVFWSHLSPIGVNPGADGVLDALERLTGKSSMQQEATP